MELSVFDGLPDSARLWIFGTPLPLDERARKGIGHHLDRFLPSWKSHEQPVQAGFTIAADRLLIVAAHLPGGLSGCSIDNLMDHLKKLGRDLAVDLLAGNLVFYRDVAGRIQAADHLSFGELVDKGEIGPDTPVIDTLLADLGQLRSGQLEKAYGESWHARAFEGTGAG